MANYFRLYLHSLAANLLVCVRHVVADPPTADPSAELPTEALAGRDRRRWFNRRREHDPLGEPMQPWDEHEVRAQSARRVIQDLPECTEPKLVKGRRQEAKAERPSCWRA